MAKLLYLPIPTSFIYALLWSCILSISTPSPAPPDSTPFDSLPCHHSHRYLSIMLVITPTVSNPSIFLKFPHTCLHFLLHHNLRCYHHPATPTTSLDLPPPMSIPHTTSGVSPTNPPITFLPSFPVPSPFQLSNHHPPVNLPTLIDNKRSKLREGEGREMYYHPNEII